MNANVRALLVMAGCTVGGLSMTGCKSEVPEDFGYTCIDLNRGESVEENPFLGTYKIIATLNYEPCLVDYYLNKHPEMRQDGKDGPAVFDEWKERLCSEDITRRVECEVESFEQVLQETGTEAYKMSISYLTPKPGELSGRKLLWGPGPLPDYAECATGLKPYVTLSSLSGVIGENKAGQTIWQIQSYGDNRGIMKLDGGGCIQAFVKPTGS
jgi:hypothetical protein